MVYKATVMALIIMIALLAGPAYGNLQRGDGQAVHAYNCHNLYHYPENKL